MSELFNLTNKGTILPITQNEDSQTVFEDNCRGINIQSTSSVSLSGNGSTCTPLYATVNISHLTGNTLSLKADGLYASGSTGTGGSTANTFTTAFTYSNNIFAIKDNAGNTFNASINTVTGLTVNGALSARTLNVSAATNPVTIQGLSATTGDTNVLSVDINGVLHAMPISSLSGATLPNNFNVFLTGNHSNDVLQPHATIAVKDKFYVGCGNNAVDGNIVCYNDPNDLTNKTTIVPFSAHMNSFYAICYSSVNDRIYTVGLVLTGTFHYNLVTINPNTNTYTSQSLTGVSVGDITQFGIDTDDTYVYIGGGTTQLFRVKISDLSLTTLTLTGGSIIHDVRYVRYSDGAEIIATSSSSNFPIYSVDPATFTVSSSLSTAPLWTDDMALIKNSGNTVAAGCSFWLGAELNGHCIKYQSINRVLSATTEEVTNSLPSYGLFTDGILVYNMSRLSTIEVWPFNLTSAQPIVNGIQYLVGNENVFGVPAWAPNELWISNSGKMFFTNYSSAGASTDSGIYQFYLSPAPIGNPWNTSVTGVTLSNNILSVTKNNFTATTSTINAVTGGSYSNGTITFSGSGSLSSITGLSTGTTLTSTDSSINISGNNISLNTGHSNTWTAQQTFTTAPVFSSITSGSVLFAGTSGLLSQDNSNLFWDDANNTLGIGNTAPFSTGAFLSGGLTVSSNLGVITAYRKANNLGFGTGFQCVLQNSSSNPVAYSYTNGFIVSNTAGSESGGLAYWINKVGTMTQAMTLNSTGNLLIGTTIDDGVNTLQVSGSGKFIGNVTIGATTGGTQRLNINESGAGLPVAMSFLFTGNTLAYVGLAAIGNQINTGSKAGDFCIRTIANNILFSTNNGTTSQVIITTGSSVLIGTTTDNGLDRLQINGNAFISKLGVGTTVTGTHAFDVHQLSTGSGQTWFAVGDQLTVGKPLVYFGTLSGTSISILDRNDVGMVLEGFTNRNTLVVNASGRVGIGTAIDDGLNRLQISATTNPLRLIGLSATTSDTSVLSTDANGTIHKYALSAITATISGGSSANTFTTASTYNSVTGVLSHTRNDNVTYTAGTWNYISANTLTNNILSVTSNGSAVSNSTINAATGGSYSNGVITLLGSGSLTTITGLQNITQSLSSATITNNIFNASYNGGATTATTINAATGGSYSNGIITLLGSGSLTTITGLPNLSTTVSSTTVANNIISVALNNGSLTASTINAATGGSYSNGVITLLGSGSLTTITGLQNITQSLSSATLTNNVISTAYNAGSATASTINAATGGSYSNGVITLLGSGSLTTITGLQTANTFTTASTYNAATGVLSHTRNDNVTYTAGTWNYSSGVTLTNNILSVTSNGGSLISTTLNAATGGTYSAGVITLLGSGSLTTITGLPTSGTGTIYSTDGTIAANRLVGLSSFTLTFSSATQPNNLVLTGGSVGIGLVASGVTNALHVSATTNPVRFQGLSATTADTSIISVDTSGVLHSATISSIFPHGVLTLTAGTRTVSVPGITSTSLPFTQVLTGVTATATSFIQVSATTNSISIKAVLTGTSITTNTADTSVIAWYVIP